ncbi:MAG: tRNA lysidine(34) synthetase TilS [candidate division Zixibacteria bacterium]|nr:tRNA lysidine(34) synthetase TilS [candidate division Zixibacteria bacterium]
MPDLITRVQEYIQSNRLIANGEKVLVACSGGPDSIALASILMRFMDVSAIELGFAHLNHKIRSEAGKDMAFVKDFARKYRIPFYGKTIDVPAYADKHDLTLEEAARECRYNFLYSIAEKKRYTKIAIGHTRDDNIETVLFNFIRGSGISGLSGIKPVRDNFIRPLLFLSKDEITGWLKSEGIAYVVDKTNLQSLYTRNRIRNKLIPEIKKEFNPNFDNSIERLSKISSEYEDFVHGETEKALQKSLIERDKSKIVLDLKKLLRYHNIIKRNLTREIIKGITGIAYPPDYQSVNSFLNLCARQSNGKTIFHAGAYAEISGNRVVFGKLKSVNLRKKITVPGNYSNSELGFSINSRIIGFVPKKFEYMNDNRNIAYFDKDKLGKNLEIRTVKPGDKIKPLGMDGHKKIMDLLAENGVNSMLKPSCLVLTSGGRIAWLIGLRTSEEFKIDSDTRDTVKFEYAEQSFN